MRLNCGCTTGLQSMPRWKLHGGNENGEGTGHKYQSKKIAVATGYYDLPNQLGVPGEDLPHVSPLLHGALRILEPGRHRDWWEKFRCGGGARILLSKWRARDAGAPEKGTWVEQSSMGTPELRTDQGRPSESVFETRVKQITNEEVVVGKWSG